jgi:hypothetical protein
LTRLAEALLEAVRASQPGLAETLGFDLTDFSAGSVALRRTVTDGPGATTLRAERVTVAGEFVVEDVTTRGGGPSPKA